MLSDASQVVTPPLLSDAPDDSIAKLKDFADSGIKLNDDESAVQPTSEVISQGLRQRRVGDSIVAPKSTNVSASKPDVQNEM